MTASFPFLPVPDDTASGPPRDAVPQRVFWRLLIVFLVGALGGLASVAVFRLAVSSEVRSAEIEFQNRARNYLQIIDAELQASSTLLYTLRAFFEASDQPVSRDAFLRFSSDLHGRVVGLRDTGWAPRVEQAHRAAFEQDIRASGEAGFEIRQRGPSGLSRAADRAEHYPILYADTGGVIRPVLGFDLASEPMRRAAVERAIASHHPTATPPIKLLTVKRPRGGVMAFIAVDQRRGTPARRQQFDRGLAYGVVDIDAMMENAIAEKARLAGIDVYIFDPAAVAGERQVYWRSSRGPAVPAPTEAAVLAGTHRQGDVSLFDQQWAIVFTPGESLEAAAWNWHSIMPLIVGLTLTAMVMAYLLVSLRRTMELENLNLRLRGHTEKIGYMAHHDTLTHLPNRALFQQRLDRAVDQLQRGTPFTLLCLDLDHFKAVNDGLGHGAGDELLRQVSQRLQSCVRDIDTVARLGGDEFAVILGGSASAEVAEAIAGRMVDAIGATFDLHGQRVCIGLSVGIALVPTCGNAAETLLARADRALYAAKACGRGRFCFSESAVQAQPSGATAPARAIAANGASPA